MATLVANLWADGSILPALSIVALHDDEAYREALNALRAAQAVAPAKLVAVAPPVARFELGTVANPDCDWMLAQGDADDVVPAAAVLAWAA